MSHEIPQEHIDFASKVCELAREAGFNKITLSVMPGWRSEWVGDVVTSWHQGRHGDASGRMFIESTVRVWKEIKDE